MIEKHVISDKQLLALMAAVITRAYSYSTKEMVDEADRCVFMGEAILKRIGINWNAEPADFGPM
jgi:hypothetical protein